MRPGLRRIVASCTTLLLLAGANKASPQDQEAPSPPAREAAAAAHGTAKTLEAIQPSLGELARRQAIEPSLENERRLGLAYVERGVLDAAFDHFQAVLRIDPNDVQANEAIARIWRDWGFANSGLPLAYRAVFWSPTSASAQNTLGTLFLKLGQLDAARERFELARRLDPTAAYPLNNLCYLSLHAQRVAEAVEWCRAASDADPDSGQVRNNLALALALDGQLDRAVNILGTDPTPATAAYNEAVLLLASRQADRARDALIRARKADPSFFPALKLLRQLANRTTGQ